MKYLLTAKQCEISDPIKIYIEKQTETLTTILPHLPEDTPLEIIIKGGQKDHSFFVTMHLPLPKHIVHVESDGDTMDAALSAAFTKTRREIQEYRGKHFPSDSSYPHKETIRTKPLE